MPQEADHPNSKPGSFLNAAEMTSLEEDAHTERKEQSQNPEVTIDERKVGNISITGVMGAHTKENGPSFAYGLRNSQIIAIEAPGVRNRAAYEAAFTKLLSSDYNDSDPAAVEDAFAQMRTTDYEGTELFASLRGSDKTVVLLDLDINDPNYPKVDHAKATRKQFVDSLFKLDKVATTRQLLWDYLGATVESDAVREPAMKHQINSLIARSANQDPPPSIGIALGSLHRDVVTSLGEPTDEAASAAAQKQIEATYSLFDQAILALKTSDHGLAIRLVERVLLSAYAFQSFRSEDGSYQPRQADDFTQEFDDAAVGRIINLIDQRLQYQMFDHATRQRDISGPLSALADIAAHKQRLKQHKQYRHS